jgi:hypothetical protein
MGFHREAPSDTTAQLAREAGLAVLRLREQIDLLQRALAGATYLPAGDQDELHHLIATQFERVDQRLDHLERRIDHHFACLTAKLDQLLGN